MLTLDSVDRRILAVLQQEGRVQNNELARKVGLSPSPCLRRTRLLEEAGVIQRYVAVLDATKIGFGLSLFPRIWLTAQDADTIDHFIEEVQLLPQVVECYIMLGDCDAMLRVVAPDLDGYRRFQAQFLSRIKGVQNIKTEVPSQTVKQSYALPLTPPA